MGRENAREIESTRCRRWFVRAESTRGIRQFPAKIRRRTIDRAFHIGSRSAKRFGQLLPAQQPHAVAKGQSAPGILRKIAQRGPDAAPHLFGLGSLVRRRRFKIGNNVLHLEVVTTGLLDRDIAGSGC